MTSSIVNILTLTPEIESKIVEEIRISRRQSKTWEQHILNHYPDIMFGKKYHHHPQFCGSPFVCLKKVVVDSRSLNFYLDRYKQSPNAIQFNAYMQSEVYMRIRHLIELFSPNLETGFNQSMKDHFTDMKQTLTKLFFNGTSQPWNVDRNQILELIGRTFVMTSSEKKQSLSKQAERNDRLAWQNLTVDYDQQRRNFLSMQDTFFEQLKEDTEKPEKILMMGCLAIMLVCGCRLLETILSKFEQVGHEQHYTLGSLDEKELSLSITKRENYPKGSEPYKTITDLTDCLVLQTGLLKKRHDADESSEYQKKSGIIKMLNFSTRPKDFLHLVESVQSLYHDRVETPNETDNKQISAKINQAKYRDPILSFYYKTEIDFLSTEIGTSTKTHWLRALSIALQYYSISKDEEVLFKNKSINKSYLGALLLGHGGLSSAYQSYNYIKVKNLSSLQEISHIFKVTDENLVVTLANRFLGFDNRMKDLQATTEETLKSYLDKEIAWESRLSFLESNSAKQLPADFPKYDPIADEGIRLEYWRKMKEFFGSIPITWENLKYSGVIKKHDFANLRALYNSDHKQTKKKVKLEQEIKTI
jgi:hypothetical protein